MFDSSVSPTRKTRKLVQRFENCQTYKESDLNLPLYSACDNPQISLLNKSQSSASFSFSSGPLSDRNSVKEEAQSKNETTIQNIGSYQNDMSNSMIKTNENKIVVLKSSARNTRFLSEDDTVSMTMNTSMRQSMFVQEQQTLPTKQRNVYLQNIRKLRDEKEGLEVHLKKSSQTIDFLHQKIKSQEFWIESLEGQIKKISEEKGLFLKNIQKLNNDIVERERRFQQQTQLLLNEKKALEEGIKNIEKELKNTKNENQWRKSNEKRRETFLNEVRKEKQDLKEKIKNLETFNAELSDKNQEIKKQLGEERKKCQALEGRKEDLLKQLISNKKQEQQKISELLSEKKIMSIELLSKIDHMYTLFSFFQILGIEMNETKISNSSDRKKIKEFLKRIGNLKDLLLEKLESNREVIVELHEAVTEELMKEKLRNLNNKYKNH